MNFFERLRAEKEQNIKEAEENREHQTIAFLEKLKDEANLRELTAIGFRQSKKHLEESGLKGLLSQFTGIVEGRLYEGVITEHKKGALDRLGSIMFSVDWDVKYIEEAMQYNYIRYRVGKRIKTTIFPSGDITFFRKALLGEESIILPRPHWSNDPELLESSLDKAYQKPFQIKEIAE